MEERIEASQRKEKSFRRLVLSYGILTGVVLSCVLFLRYSLSLPVSAPMGIAECVLLFLIAAFCLYKFQGSSQGKEAGFGRRFAFSLLVAIVGLMIYAVMMYIYIYILCIDTNMQARCLALQRKYNADGGLGDAELMEMIRPSYIAFSAAFLGGVISLIWAFILAFFGRRGRKGRGVKENKELSE
mgnify:CR=1 FL=1